MSQTWLHIGSTISLNLSGLTNWTESWVKILLNVSSTNLMSKQHVASSVTSVFRQMNVLLFWSVSAAKANTPSASFALMNRTFRVPQSWLVNLKFSFGYKWVLFRYSWSGGLGTLGHKSSVVTNIGDLSLVLLRSELKIDRGMHAKI